jgi:hypothetical protein
MEEVEQPGRTRELKRDGCAAQTKAVHLQLNQFRPLLVLLRSSAHYPGLGRLHPFLVEDVYDPLCMPLLRKKSTPDDARRPVVSGPSALGSHGGPGSPIYTQRAQGSASNTSLSNSKSVSKPSVLQRKSNRDVRASMPAQPHPQQQQSYTQGQDYGNGNGRPSVLSQAPPGAAPAFAQMNSNPAMRSRQSLDAGLGQGQGGGGYPYGQAYKPSRPSVDMAMAMGTGAGPSRGGSGYGRQVNSSTLFVYTMPRILAHVLCLLCYIR